MLIYLIGRYVRLFGNHIVGERSNFLMWLSYVLSLIILSLLMFVIKDNNRWLSYNSPVVISSATLLLLCFSKIKLQNKVINWIASSCLAVYVFHTSSSIIGWFVGLDVQLFETQSFMLYILEMAGIIFFVFMVAVLLDKIRMHLANPILNLVNIYLQRSDAREM